MNKRVVLIALLVAIAILGITTAFSQYQITDNDIFKNGTGYLVFDLTKITIENPTHNNVMGTPSTTHTLYGTPFWFYYKMTGSSTGMCFSVLPIILNFLIIFAICLLIIYRLYKSKYKKMLGFKDENKKPYPHYEPLWNFVEPGYYDIDMFNEYGMDDLYYMRNKKRKKKNNKVKKKSKKRKSK